MRIVTISDTHTKHEKIDVPDGDILLFAGDCSSRGSLSDVQKFVEWYSKQPHAFKVMIAGNHDFGFEDFPVKFEQICTDHGVIYLKDTSVEIMGIKIHGSPVTPKFYNWAFNRSRTIKESMSQTSQLYGHSYIGNHWDKIPEDTDILITHGPPNGILDKTNDGTLTGCSQLLRHIKERLNLKMHVFGHIHEARDVLVRFDMNSPCVTFVNASSLNSSYLPQSDDTFVFDWDKVVKGESFGRD